MHSKYRNPWAAALFVLLDEAASRGATSDEVMELLDDFDRMRRDVTATRYEVASPFAIPGRTGPY
jgi:hypothetical protein